MKLVKTSYCSVICIVAAVAMVCATNVQADSAGTKLCRGLAGVGLGFLELPGNMVEVSKEEGVAMGLSGGFFKGLMMTIVRYTVGIYETLTFPIAVPAEYRSPVAPDYPWGYFTGADTKALPPGEKVEPPAIVPFSEKPAKPAQPAQPAKR
ncbi:MAG: exosortase system-associated protein, TIGR04073 family [Verrucomicrobia bacterium]|nr:exosortase system-associated protein, TIGR04073 family [Verrucomicrobiota bacterium]